MKTAILIVAAVLGITAFSFSSNESNEMQTDVFNPGEFYGLISNANANIVIEQGDKHSIKIVGTHHQIENIQIRVVDGALLIDGNEGSPVTIYLTAEDLSLIEVNGNSKVLVNGIVNSDILLLKAGDNGSIKADIRALKVGLIARGKGRLIVSGTCGDCFTRISEKGNIYTNSLDALNRIDEKVAMKADKKSEKRATLKLNH
jgi:hypothetical protein